MTVPQPLTAAPNQPVPLAPVDMHPGPEVPPAPAYVYRTTIDPVTAGQWASVDQAIVSNPFAPSPRKV